MMSSEAGSEGKAAVFWCMFYASGIIGCLLVYGVWQERIMDHAYGGAFFTASVFLVGINRLIAVVFSICMIFSKGEAIQNKAPLWCYLLVSLSNVFASTCQYEALKYVSFPVQQLGKSFKMIPVMCWGIVISGKSYGFSDWMIAALVTWGVTQFLLFGSISASHSDGNSSVYGLVLLLCFLGLDSLTSTMQEKLFKEYKTSKYNQMMYINGSSAIVSGITLLASGNLFPAIAFCSDHPAFVTDALTLSAAAVGGQWFIYSQVKEFGALVLAATMNVRQTVSIIVSYIRFGHPITPLQVFGLIIVFSALFYKSSRGLGSGNKDKSEKAPLVPTPETPYGLEPKAGEAALRPKPKESEGMP